SASPPAGGEATGLDQGQCSSPDDSTASEASPMSPCPGSDHPRPLVRSGRSRAMKPEVIRVEPLSTFLERRKAPASVGMRQRATLYVSGLPRLDPETGEIVDAPLAQQTEIVLEQLKRCVETAGSSLEKVVRCTVYCTSADSFAAVNAIYARYFPKDPPARMFVV